MNIKYKDKDRLVLITDLTPGTVFEDQDFLFIVAEADKYSDFGLDKNFAVRLEDGKLWEFSDEDMVRLVNATLVVE